MAERSEIGKTPLVKILGRSGSATAYAIRDYLHRSDVPFEWIQLENDEQARTQAVVHDLHESPHPILRFTHRSPIDSPNLTHRNQNNGSLASLRDFRRRVS